MSHPSPELLALYASADLPWLDRWKIRRHLSDCDECDRQLAILRASTAELKRQARAETLTGFEAIADWSRLEREMQANIVVGLAAARCVGSSSNRRGAVIKLSLATAMLVLFVLGWVTHVPAEQSSRLFSTLRGAFANKSVREFQRPILKTQPGGIIAGSPEGSLTLRYPGVAAVSLSGASSIEARYVDDETGRVTITNVYGQ